jgi:hypothetical protein
VRSLTCYGDRFTFFFLRTVWRVLRKRLHSKAYKPPIVQGHKFASSTPFVPATREEVQTLILAFHMLRTEQSTAQAQGKYLYLVTSVVERLHALHRRHLRLVCAELEARGGCLGLWYAALTRISPITVLEDALCTGDMHSIISDETQSENTCR